MIIATTRWQLQQQEKQKATKAATQNDRKRGYNDNIGDKININNHNDDDGDSNSKNGDNLFPHKQCVWWVRAGDLYKSPQRGSRSCQLALIYLVWMQVDSQFMVETSSLSDSQMTGASTMYSCNASQSKSQQHISLT